MNSDQEKTLITFFKAAGHPERIRILGLLANKPHSVPELAERLNLKQKDVSRHLRALQKAGLVRADATAFATAFYFNQSGLENLNEIVDGNVEPETLAERVMRQYVVKGRLTAVPIHAEEREVILRWMADKFEPDRRYTEAEVNELVATYYKNPLTLRRILADNRFLLHTGRHYWRPLPEHSY